MMTNEEPSFRAEFRGGPIDCQELCVSDAFPEIGIVLPDATGTRQIYTYKLDEPIVDTFTIITRPAVGAVKRVHDRMPAILENDQLEAWLDPKRYPTAIENPCRAELKPYAVSTSVNNSRNEGPECARRIFGPVREKVFRDGAIVSVRNVGGGPRLPEELPAGSMVKVVSADVGAVLVEFDGREFKIPASCAIAGYEYQASGKWFDENDPSIKPFWEIEFPRP